MTDLLLHPDDSGEVARLPGETARLITAAERNRLLGEQTENLGQYFRPDAPFGYLRKTIELDDTVYFHIPETIGIVPDPETERLSLLGSVAGLDGELRPAAPGPKPGPLPPTPPPAPQPKPSYAGRHRLTFGRRVRRLLAGLGVMGAALVAIWAGLTMAAVAVFL